MKERCRYLRSKQMVLAGERFDGWDRQVSLRLEHGLVTETKRGSIPQMQDIDERYGWL